jgi:hypothetical protein
MAPIQEDREIFISNLKRIVQDFCFLSQDVVNDITINDKTNSVIIDFKSHFGLKYDVILKDLPASKDKKVESTINKDVFEAFKKNLNF